MPGCCCPYRPWCCSRPCDCCPGRSICCRPPWSESPPRPPRFPNFCAFPLACRSQRYLCWLSKVGPKVDTNLGASLMSSRVENEGCHMVAVQPPIECDQMNATPCPCHF